MRLATEIRRMGRTCKVIDLFTKLNDKAWEILIDKYVDKDTRLIGISTTLLSTYFTGDDLEREVYFWGMPYEIFRERIAMIRRRAPNALIVVGGSQVGIETAATLTDYIGIFDLFISGQGEGPIKAIIRHLYDGTDLKITRAHDVPFVTQESYPNHNFKTSDIVWLPEDLMEYGEGAVVEVARGCVFKCSYCTYDLIGKSWGDMVKDPGVLRRELMRNYEMWGTTHYMIPDDTFNDSIEKVRMLHKVFTSLPFQIEFGTYIRLDLFMRNPDMAKLLLEMGIRGGNLGIETLNKKAGRLIGKGMGEERVKETAAQVREVWGNKVVMRANFILGLPEEDEDSMYRTLEWLTDPDCPFHYAEFNALRIDRDAPKSKMELEDMKRLGYTFENRMLWSRKSDGMSYRRAQALKLEFKNKIYQSRPYAAMVMAFGVPDRNNVGISTSEITRMLDARVDLVTSRGETKPLGRMMRERTRPRTDHYIRRLVTEEHEPQTLLPYGVEPVKLISLPGA
ncbi:B12-binding domain-containing radical SAM protein [Vreelandella sulfidaeris]